MDARPAKTILNFAQVWQHMDLVLFGQHTFQMIMCENFLYMCHTYHSSSFRIKYAKYSNTFNVEQAKFRLSKSICQKISSQIIQVLSIHFVKVIQFINTKTYQIVYMEPKLPFKSPSWILFLICMILEIAGLIVLALVQRSICIAAYEISNGVMVFIPFLFTAVFPDIVYVIGTIFMHDLGKEPLAIMYNLIIGLCCLVGSIFLLVILTFCGNSAQLLIFISAFLGLFAGVLHLVNFGLSHWQLPKEELYVIPPVKRKE